MLAIDDIVLLALGLAMLSWTAYDSRSLRGESDERALWVVMAAEALAQVVRAQPVYGLIEACTGPGWSMVIFHALSIVVGIAVLDLLHQLTERTRRLRRVSLGAGIAVAALSLLPWIIATPARVPPELRGVNDFYDAGWASALHWGVVMAYLIGVTVTSSLHCLRTAWQDGPRRVRTSMLLISSAGAAITVCCLGHIGVQAAWLLHRGARLTRLDGRWDAATMGPGVLLLALGVSWMKLGDLRDRRRHLHRVNTVASRVSTIRPHWVELTAAFPTMSPWAETLRVPAVDDEQLDFQQRRMVLEVADAHHRLWSYLSGQDLRGIAAEVHRTGLRGRSARVAGRHVAVSVALRRHARGIEPVCEGFLDTTRTPTVDAAARHLAEGLRCAQRHRHRIDRITATILAEGHDDHDDVLTGSDQR